MNHLSNNNLTVEDTLEEDKEPECSAINVQSDEPINTPTVSIQQMEIKLLKANMKVNKILNSQIRLKKRVKRLTYENRKLVIENNNLKVKYKHIFNDDQIEALCKNKCARWSTNSIQKALRLKLSCGSSGYKELQKQNIPLPSERTLRRKMENIDFEPGISNHAFDILREQVLRFTDDRDKDCMLAIDEMSIIAGQQIDTATNSHIGLSTLPDKSGKYAN